jgi:hypothetical protein
MTRAIRTALTTCTSCRTMTAIADHRTPCATLGEPVTVESTEAMPQPLTSAERPAASKAACDPSGVTSCSTARHIAS